jgi:hypothetical protein
MKRSERMRTALRSTDDDIFDDDNGRIVVCGKNDAGELVELGSLSYSLFYQQPEKVRSIIEKIRFGF